MDLTLKVVAVLSLVLIAVVVTVVGIEIVDYLKDSESAWTARWGNVINRGPVQ